MLVEGIRPVLPLIRNTPYGKRIQNKLQRENLDGPGFGGSYGHAAATGDGYPFSNFSNYFAAPTTITNTTFTFGAAPVPVMLAWKTLADSKSLYNTPAVLSIYVTGLVLERIDAQGGLKYYEELNRRKALKVYSAVNEGQEKGVFRKKVKDGSESWMNVVFEVLGDGAEKRFLDGAEKQGMKGLKGHRSVGGTFRQPHLI